MTLDEWVIGFWGRVKLHPNGCLIWLGSTNPVNDYPQCKIPLELQIILELNCNITQVYRAIYAYKYRSNPLFIHHKCLDRCCVNGNHHEWVSRELNNQYVADVKSGSYDNWPATTFADEEFF